jgi:hypothetical protein
MATFQHLVVGYLPGAAEVAEGMDVYADMNEFKARLAQLGAAGYDVRDVAVMPSDFAGPTLLAFLTLESG